LSIAAVGNALGQSFDHISKLFSGSGTSRLSQCAQSTRSALTLTAQYSNNSSLNSSRTPLIWYRRTIGRTSRQLLSRANLRLQYERWLSVYSCFARATQLGDGHDRTD